MIINNNISDRAAALKAEALDNSSLFDVHTWASDEAKEVNSAVHILYQSFLTNPLYRSNQGLDVRKKHIKTLLLDLYLSWLSDPLRYLSVYRAHWYYENLNSRYNKLHISSVTPAVIDMLLDQGYITYFPGHYSGPNAAPEYRNRPSHVSRIRATPKLIKLIKKVKLRPDQIEKAPNTETVILRKYDFDKDQMIDCPYEDDVETNLWRKNLVAYNNLLRKTYIDVPSAPTEGIPCKQGYRARKKKKKPRRLKVSHYDKFVRRIFNNESWDQGGRFYGGWWQRIPEEWRTRIRIWNMPVSEIDFKGLHIALLYKLTNHEMVGDPYELDKYEKTKEMRLLLKKTLLSSINAATPEEAFKVINMEVNLDPQTFGWVREEKLDLKELIEDIKEKHPLIEDRLFKAKGIELQKIDSIIAEKIINKYTQEGIAVLCVHDSFVIQADKAADLNEYMKEAFNEAMEEMGLNSRGEPALDVDGLGINQFQTILTHPDWKELMYIFYREQYDYSGWYKSMRAFQGLNIKDHYIVE